MKTIKQYGAIGGYAVTMVALYFAFVWYTVKGVKISGDDSGAAKSAVAGPGAHSNNHFYHK